MKMMRKNLTWRGELRKIISLSWPVAIASLCRLAIYSTDAAYVGHVGTLQLSGVTLANAWTQLLTVIIQAPGYVLNSICSQAIGAKNKKLAGNWLQLALVTCSLLCALVVTAYFFTRPIVAFIVNNGVYGSEASKGAHDVCAAPSRGVSEPAIVTCSAEVSNATAIADYAQEFNNLYALVLWPTIIYMCVRQYFQALQIVIPATIVSALTVGINVGINQMLVFSPGNMGLRGSPLATFTSMLFQLGSFCIFCFAIKKYHAEFWGAGRGKALKGNAFASMQSL